jgi:hypothetical protein
LFVRAPARASLAGIIVGKAIGVPAFWPMARATAMIEQGLELRICGRGDHASRPALATPNDLRLGLPRCSCANTARLASAGN